MTTSKSITYFDGSQKLVSQLFQPQAIDSATPAVLVFPAFEGRGEFTLDYAKRLADAGYVALAVDMYGDAKVGARIDDCFALVKPFFDDRTLARNRALLAYHTLQQTYPNAKIGAVGFCFGGLCVLELARNGTAFAAGVSIHGALTQSNLPTHPISTKLLILHGYKDPMFPPETLVPFAEEMQAAGNMDWIFTFFGDAEHSFSDPRTGTYEPEREKAMGRAYNQRVADYSYRYVLDFFKTELATT